MSWPDALGTKAREARGNAEDRQEVFARLLDEREPGAFEAVIRRHNRRLYRVARSILRDDAEAEDAVQEAYVRALGNLDRFRGESCLSTWLTRIVINEALGKRRGKRPAVALSEVDDVGARGHELTSPHLRRLIDDGAEGAAARAQLRRVIEREIENLPEAYRPVFILRAVEGLSVEETAAHLGIAEATVKTRFHRARKLLQRGLGEVVAETLKDSFPFAGERCARMTRNVLGRLGLTG
jgi:RNA polymerase sigma-70 factor, ECF subfamily